jgi:hypothetical protein
MKKTIVISFIAISLMLCGFAKYKSSTVNTPEKTSINSTNTKHYSAADLVDFDLSANGLPIITKAPQGARVIIEKSSGDIIVYGGKFFKITFKKNDFKNPFSDDEEFENIAAVIDFYKSMASDADMNPSFDKFEIEEENGYLKKNKDGKLSFLCGLKVGTNAVLMSEGMTYDLSPDKYTDYSVDDVKVMFQAAKATKIK